MLKLQTLCLYWRKTGAGNTIQTDHSSKTVLYFSQGSQAVCHLKVRIATLANYPGSISCEGLGLSLPI